MRILIYVFVLATIVFIILSILLSSETEYSPGLRNKQN